MAYVNFNRTKTLQDAVSGHSDTIYFTTDTQDIVMDGQTYGGSNVELSDAAIAYSDFSKAGSSLKLVYNDNNKLELKLDRSVQYNVTLTTPAYIWYGSTGPLTFIVKSNDFTEGEGVITIDLGNKGGHAFESLRPNTEESTNITLNSSATSDITVQWYIGQTKQKDKTIQCRLPILYRSSVIEEYANFSDSLLQTTAGSKYNNTFAYNHLTPTFDEIYIGIPGSHNYFEYMSGASQCDCRTITKADAKIYINGQEQTYTIFKCRVTSGFEFYIKNIY